MLTPAPTNMHNNIQANVSGSGQQRLWRACSTCTADSRRFAAPHKRQRHTPTSRERGCKRLIVCSPGLSVHTCYNWIDKRVDGADGRWQSSTSDANRRTRSWNGAALPYCCLHTMVVSAAEHERLQRSATHRSACRTSLPSPTIQTASHTPAPSKIQLLPGPQQPSPPTGLHDGISYIGIVRIKSIEPTASDL